MEEDKISEAVAKSKTLCCNATWYIKGRANYRCSKCDADVTLHIVLLTNALQNN